MLLMAVGALVLVPASATAGPSAGKAVADDALARYTGPQKVKIEKRMSYFMICTEDCSLTVSSTLVVPGPDPPTLVDQKNFAANTKIEAFVIVKSRAGRNFLKANVGKSEIKSKISVVGINSGDTDTDKRTFKLKL